MPDSEPKKYRLRVDVAKPTELYKPSFGPSRISPGPSSGKGPPMGGAASFEEGRAAEPAMIRALDGKRSRKPVDRMPAGGDVRVDLYEANGSRVVTRVLSRRVHEGGATSYLVVWGAAHVTTASWHPKASLIAHAAANAPLLSQFDAAVRRVRGMSMRELAEAASSLSTLGLPNATYFQGISSRGADGSVRRPREPSGINN